MQLLKKILPLGVLLLSGCTTVIDEHQGCSPDPVYIYFTSHSDINVGVDITTTRNGEAEPLPIGMMGMGYSTTADVIPSLNSFTTTDGLLHGLQNDKYEMVPSGESSYNIDPSEGVKTPEFPYIDSSAVSIYAYAPYNDTITPQHTPQDGWHLPIDVKADGGQTDYLYANTTISKGDYLEQGSIDLRLTHALIRLDVIIEYDEIIIGGGTEDNTEDDDEIIIGGGTEDNTEDDDEIIIGGGTEDNTEDDDEVIIGGGTEDNTEDESTESTPTISYVTDDNIKAKNDCEILAPGLRTTRSGDDETLTIKLYTNNDGQGYLRLKYGTVKVLNPRNYINGNNTVTQSIIPNDVADADTVTFYLLPGTKLFQFKMNDTTYKPYQGNNKDEANPMDYDQLPTTPGHHREIKIKHP